MVSNCVKTFESRHYECSFFVIHSTTRHSAYLPRQNDEGDKEVDVIYKDPDYNANLFENLAKSTN